MKRFLCVLLAIPLLVHAEDIPASASSFEELRKLAAQKEVWKARAEVLKLQQQVMGEQPSSQNGSGPVPLVDRQGPVVGAISPIGQTPKAASNTPKQDYAAPSEPEMRLMKLIGYTNAWSAQVLVGESVYDVQIGQYVNGWNFASVTPEDRCVVFEKTSYESSRQKSRKKKPTTDVNGSEVKEVRQLCFYKKPLASAKKAPE